MASPEILVDSVNQFATTAAYQITEAFKPYLHIEGVADAADVAIAGVLRAHGRIFKNADMTDSVLTADS